MDDAWKIGTAVCLTLLGLLGGLCIGIGFVVGTFWCA